MNRKLTLAVMTLLLTIGMSSAVAYADTITVTLTDPTQIVSAPGGAVLTYILTVSAPASNGADVFLNGDTLNSSSPFALDDSDFFSSFPFTLAPGTSFTGDAFTVTVGPTDAPGTYVGAFTVQGGADSFAAVNLGTADFTAIVTPEPSSLLLLGSGLTGLIGLARRKRMM